MNVMKYKSLWKMNRIGFMVRYVKASNIEYYDIQYAAERTIILRLR